MTSGTNGSSLSSLEPIKNPPKRCFNVLLDLEGIVAKHKFGPYLEEAAQWFKIRNRKYSQWSGREITCQSANFPTTPGSFQSKSTEMGPFGDAFVTKLNPSGSALVYSSFLGGNLEDSGNGIAIDSGGHAYVAGTTQSANFPTTAGAFQSQNPDTLNTNGFISKFSADGTALVYSTYLGGEFLDSISSIAVDSLGNSYVTGATSSGNFPFADPFPQSCVTTATGVGKVFVTKLNQAGSALAYSICVGGGFSDFITTPGAF